MNDKIKEFAEKSGIASFLTNGSVVSPWVEDTDIRDYVKEFAELIIKECLKVAEDTVDDGDAACCTNMADIITRNIKYHFGVKE